MTDLKETGFDYLDSSPFATFSSSETKWINRILSLKEERPDEVDIQYYPEDNQGMLVAHLPKKWMKISPPRTREMTDEQREAAAKRLADARSKRKG